MGGKKVYYKLSNHDSTKGVVGHECFNEIIVDRLLCISAYAMRNYITHRNNAVKTFHVGCGGNAVYMSRKCLLSDPKTTDAQKKAIEQCEEQYDLSLVAEKTLEVSYHIMEELLDFQMDEECANAVSILLEAHAKIQEAGINSDIWMICRFGKPQWEPSLSNPLQQNELKMKMAIL